MAEEFLFEQDIFLGEDGNVTCCRVRCYPALCVVAESELRRFLVLLTMDREDI